MRTSPYVASLRRGLLSRETVYRMTQSSLAIAVLVVLPLATSTTNAQCTNGCADYGSVLSAACDSCTSSCNRLSAAGTGCGCEGAACASGGGLSDFVYGTSCGCDGHSGGCSGCGGSGSCGNYWNSVCGEGSPCGGLGGGLLSSRRCSGSGWLRGLLSGCGCGNQQSDDCESPVFCGMPAPSYPVPYAVPQLVGQTQFSYAPFMPHHSLPHYRKTYSFQHAPGLSRTNVHWRTTTGLNILARLHNMIELPR